MRTLAVCAVLLLCVACTPEPPQSGTEATPDAVAEAHLAPTLFLTELYSHYDGKQQNFSPMGDAAPLYFDDELVALIREDARLSGGEIGALDHDPVCQCQDYDRIQAKMTAQSVTATTARITATLTDTGRAAFTVTYDLVREDDQWRIHDMSSATMKSLRTLLKASNAKTAGKAA